MLFYHTIMHYYDDFIRALFNQIEQSSNYSYNQQIFHSPILVENQSEYFSVACNNKHEVCGSNFLHRYVFFMCISRHCHGRLRQLPLVHKTLILIIERQKNLTPLPLKTKETSSFISVICATQTFRTSRRCRNSRKQTELPKIFCLCP